MSSPISFGGFAQINFRAPLNAVTRQEQLLGRSKSFLTAKSAEYATLATKIADLQAAVSKLATREAFGGRTVANPNKGALTVIPGATATLGTFDVVVNEIARGQVTASNSSHSDKDTTTVATGGTLTIGGTVVTIGSGVTLQGLSDAINATPGIGVTATIVSPAAGSHQLVLTGTDTGATNGFLVTNSLTDGSAPVTFIDSDIDGTSGDTASDNAVQATDAQVAVNNISFVSATNTLTSAIPGATLTLLSSDSGVPVTVTIGEDTASTKALVEDFVTAFAALEQYADEQVASAGAGNKGSLGRDPLVRSLISDIRGVLTSSYSVGGAYRFLTEVGIGFDGGGELTFTKATFDTAQTAAPADIQKLFVSGDGRDGAFTALHDRLESYTQAGGLLPEAQRRHDDQVERVSDRITTLEDRLAIRRTVLKREFIAADLATTTLNQSAQSLSALTGQYQLF
ncbi:MAG: flagellar filament capping protein FliD [Vicinamibacterales bacterium]|jgi:flagellar hook-associated protein 2|nr:flagellar filament capping protein FliD [Vicinamibacterales bacterium]